MKLSVKVVLKYFIRQFKVLLVNNQSTDHQTSSVGGGKDALAESRVQIKINDKRYPGRGTSQDVLEASPMLISTPLIVT